MSNFTVKGGGREMRVIIPPTGDKAEDEYLEQAEREKTKKQLEDNPRTFRPNKQSSEALRELRDFRNRKRENSKKYF